MIRRLVSLVLLVLGALAATVPPPSAGANPVVVVPIAGTIDAGMAHLVDRAVRDARDRHARAIVLEVNTFGGLVSAATEIRDALFAADVPVYAYVSQRAWSAGALITLSASKIAMAPGSSIGAAEPIPKTVKTVSALRGEFESTAARNHRNPKIAGAMVDATLNVPPYKGTGAILTLTADDAVRARVADAVVPTMNAAFAGFGLRDAGVVTAQYSFGERVARFATNPEISGILLTIGFLGLLIEMQTLHGIAGTLGVAALALFFGTHVYAGFSNGFVIALAIAGLLGILFELHVLPGHGIAGTVGTIALVSAIVLAFGIAFVFIALQAVAIAIVLTAIFFMLATRIYPENAFMRRLVFVGAQGPDYVTSANYRDLIGQTGIASSYLRPAGVATIAGRRVDVLTEGDFVTAGSALRVTRVEGARIFVKPIENISP
ncbi:MAG: nodulation protein NfeD [Candidatus Velthaea sp.]